MCSSDLTQPTAERGYLAVSREWKSGDVVELNFPMPVQRIAANPNVKANQGLLAIQRGPLVYCLEQVDQPEPIASLFLPPASELKAEKDSQLLGGIVVIKGMAEMAAEQDDWMGRLYQVAGAARRVPITAIPYYAWDNRKAGPMKVWLPMVPATPVVGGLETQAKVSVSFANNNAQPAGINDGVEPKNSGEQPNALCHWWPHKNSAEWAQYTWKKPVAVKGAKVYWFDDTGRGNCRLPQSWRIEYLDGGDWKPVSAKSEYLIAKDKWCEVAFEPVSATTFRLAVKLQKDWAAGVHEWKLTEAEED